MNQKLFLRIFTFFHVALYRLTNGKLGGRMNGLPVLLLHTVGRKTGRNRITPLGYFEHNGSYVVTGSNAGMSSHPGWYYNLTANSQASVQVGPGMIPVKTDSVGLEQYEKLWKELTSLAPSYMTYTRKTGRKIPILVLYTNAKG